jgi:hypothetical protein
MGPELWREIKIVLPRALELEPPERARYLQEVYRRQPALREELESLLRSHERHQAFLETPFLGRAGQPAANNSRYPLKRRTHLTPLGRLMRYLGRHRRTVWAVTLTSLFHALLGAAGVLGGALRVLSSSVLYAVIILVGAGLIAAALASYHDSGRRRPGEWALLAAMLLAGLAIVWCFAGPPRPA